MDLIQSTSSRTTVSQIALALQIFGVKKVKITGSLIVATHKGQTVNIRLCRENIPFIWWVDASGVQHLGYNLRSAFEALGVDFRLRSGVLLARALKSLGLTNRNDSGPYSQDFYVHGEYNSAGERIRTLADFRNLEAHAKVKASWDELKGALDLTGYSFKLHSYTERSCYITN